MTNACLFSAGLIRDSTSAWKPYQTSQTSLGVATKDSTSNIYQTQALLSSHTNDGRTMCWPAEDTVISHQITWNSYNANRSLIFQTCHDNKTQENKELTQESVTHAVLLAGTSLTTSVWDKNSYPSGWCCYAGKKSPTVYAVPRLRHFWPCLCYSDDRSTWQREVFCHHLLNLHQGTLLILSHFLRHTYFMTTLTHSYLRN